MLCHFTRRAPMRSCCATRRRFPARILSTSRPRLGDHVPISTDTVPFRPVLAPTLRSFPALFAEISKSRLATLVTLTTMCSYALAPSSSAAIGLDIPTLAMATTGTALCVASANAWNQWLEVPFDAQMARTKNRVLVRRAVTPLQVVGVAAATAIGGTALLAAINPTAALLGAANIVLYSFVYTPMKRIHTVNTWIGAVVGAIPPVIGWAASTGNIFHPGCLVLATLLYSWQFPHFMALSYLIRGDYIRAGYRMCASTRPVLNVRVALRHALVCATLSVAAPLSGLTTWWFALDSGIVNCYMLARSVQFSRKSSKQSARDLFFASLMHLPLVLALMMLHKKPLEEQAVDVDDVEMESGL